MKNVKPLTQGYMVELESLPDIVTEDECIWDHIVTRTWMFPTLDQAKAQAESLAKTEKSTMIGQCVTVHEMRFTNELGDDGEYVPGYKCSWHHIQELLAIELED